MSQDIWYVFQSQQQSGPYRQAQIEQMIDNKMISENAFLFKAGWKDWRPLAQVQKEVFEQAGFVERAVRAEIQARVFIHNQKDLIVAGGINLSNTGIFVKTKEDIFEVGEKLKLTCTHLGFYPGFHAEVEVVRFNADPNFEVGFGLRFLSLSEDALAAIAQYTSSKSDLNQTG